MLGAGCGKPDIVGVDRAVEEDLITIRGEFSAGFAS